MSPDAFVRPLGGCLLIAGSLLMLGAGARGDDLRERQQRLATLAPAAKEELQRKEKRFRALPPEERQRLRDLHTAITTAPDAPQLQQSITRYHAWLKTLRAGERAEVQSLPPTERLAKIRAIMDQQSIQRFQRLAAEKLGPPDMLAIGRWLQEYLERHEQELLDSLPDDQRERARTNPFARRFLLMGTLLRPNGGGLKISAEEMQDLVSQLSEPARSLLEAETDPRQQARMVRGWIEAAMLSLGRGGGRMLPPVNNDQLTKFLQDEISDRDREYLEGLPAERFRREAERLFHFYRMRSGRDRPGGRREGPFPGGPPREPRGDLPPP